ncbi:MAG: phytase esterase [Chthoniobacteraceae bacterium]|nr:phytase esterase [Chthoniobacteraceae bacterium]
MKSATRLFRIPPFLAALLCSFVGNAAEVKIEPVAGQPFLTVTSDLGSDFSGLTWLNGDNYIAISDKVRGIFPLKLHVDHTTGQVSDGAFGPKIPIETQFGDFEGVASAAGRFFISAEKGNAIFSVNRDGGDLRLVKLPPIFSKARPNKSLESLTFGAGSLWTANEEALECDGPISGESQGTLVRIQKFDSASRPVAQFAYKTERCGWRVQGAGTGVSDLLALPNGTVLALERVITHLGLVVKIFQIDFSGASDTSKLPSLADESKFVPTTKTLLFTQATLTANFEGITLGPELEGGWRSLILVADSGGAPTHLFMGLRIKLGGK